MVIQRPSFAYRVVMRMRVRVSMQKLEPQAARTLIRLAQGGLMDT